MNNLSWFIYLTQLVDASTIVFIWAAVLTGGHLGLSLVITTIRGESAYIEAEGYKAASAARRAIWQSWKPKVALHITVFMTFIAIALAIPSRQTMILVAGSEMGEQVLASNAVKDVVNPGMDLVKNWIRSENDKLTKASK